MASKIGVKTTPLQLLALTLLIAVAARELPIASGYDYGCSIGLCCDDDGRCTTWSEGGSCSSDTGLDAIVTDSFLDGIKQQSLTCPGNNFYSRSAFLNASNSYPEFGTTGSQEIPLREIAAFFTQITWASGLCVIVDAKNGTSNDYCDNTNTLWPCNPSKDYYPRGPIQLTWNYNYGPAGKSIGFDGLNNPEIVAKDPIISFKTAFWFWMEYAHSNFTSGQGFGATIRAINPTYCDGGNPNGVSQLVQIYSQFCQQLGVTPGDNLSC